MKKLKLNEIASQIVFLKSEAGRLGLYKTMHALEHAVINVGWELTEHPQVKLESYMKSRNKYASWVKQAREKQDSFLIETFTKKRDEYNNKIKHLKKKLI